MHAVAFLWRSEDSHRSQLFPSIVCSEDQTQVIWCGSKYPYLMSHLPGPISVTLPSQFPYLYSEQERQAADFIYSSGILLVKESPPIRGAPPFCKYRTFKNQNRPNRPLWGCGLEVISGFRPLDGNHGSLTG